MLACKTGNAVSFREELEKFLDNRLSKGRNQMAMAFTEKAS